ncbi:MAG: septum formation initiator family protein [Clostridiales Family XIII bacterium]|jgi:cell division protein FtsB|nr:septum formation initiator family protein [Clostridiales Family XIII bacterium]
MNRQKRNEKIINIANAQEKRKERRSLQKSKRGVTPVRRKSRVFVYRKFYAAIILILLVTASVYTARIMALKTDEARVTAEFEAALDKKARLENELEYIDDPIYIEQQARTRLRMVKPGEVYYVLPERGDEAEDGGRSENETGGSE